MGTIRKGCGYMRRWIGRRQVNAVAALSQCDCNRSSDGRFTDATFSHGENNAATRRFDVVDKLP
jgi:hypothetical protein